MKGLTNYLHAKSSEPIFKVKKNIKKNCNIRKILARFQETLENSRNN